MWIYQMCKLYNVSNDLLQLMKDWCVIVAARYYICSVCVFVCVFLDQDQAFDNVKEVFNSFYLFCDWFLVDFFMSTNQILNVYMISNWHILIITIQPGYSRSEIVTIFCITILLPLEYNCCSSILCWFITFRKPINLLLQKLALFPQASCFSCWQSNTFELKVVAKLSFSSKKKKEKKHNLPK